MFGVLRCKILSNVVCAEGGLNGTSPAGIREVFFTFPLSSHPKAGNNLQIEVETIPGGVLCAIRSPKRIFCKYLKIPGCLGVRFLSVWHGMIFLKQITCRGCGAVYALIRLRQR